MQNLSNLILADASDSAESFNLIGYYQTCLDLDSLFKDYSKIYEKLNALMTANQYRCESYISTLLSSCGISEEALFGVNQNSAQSNASGGSFLKSLWVRIKNIFLAMYQAIKTFFKRLFDVNVRHKKKISALQNDFILNASAACKSSLNQVQVILVPKAEFNAIIDNLDSLYSKIHRSGISGDPAYISPYIQNALNYFRIDVRDGIVYTKITDLKPITVETQRLDDPNFGWGNGNIFENLNVGTNMLLEILTKAEALNIQSTGLENECAAALRKIDQYSASGNVADAIKTQDELYAIQKRANFVISINKIYQAYVSQLAEIFRNLWTNLNNYSFKTK